MRREWECSPEQLLPLPRFCELTHQVDEARQAIEREEYVRAVNILSAELADRPTADAYLYLGIAYRHMKENLDAAVRVQESLLPQALPETPGARYAWPELVERVTGRPLGVEALAAAVTWRR